MCSRKREIKRQSKIYEEKIAADFDYVQEHAGSFLMSGVSSLIFPKHKKGNSEKKSHSGSTGDSFNFMSLAKSMLVPTAIAVVQPLLLSWGLGKFPTWIINFLLKRLKKK
ncbi:MAG: hypothetical protein LIP01_02425 [Tannerellaceae bacterium]|nr:hypothetical protein [Tannerellaceae bacterium]